MNLVELDRALRQLRLSGMADVLEARLRHAQTERLAPLDFLSALVGDELVRRRPRAGGPAEECGSRPAGWRRVAARVPPAPAACSGDTTRRRSTD